MADAKVELRVKKGQPTIPSGVRINGFELPAVTHITVDYPVRDARKITITILPTDVIEVDESEWEAASLPDPTEGAQSFG